MKTQKIVLSALFGALIYVVTAFTKIPMIGGGEGYVHLGDLAIFLACYYVGGWYAVASVTVGSVLADLTVFPSYALATLVVKGLMATVSMLICSKLKQKWGMVVAFSAGALVMVAGYFTYETFVYGAAVAVLSIVGNLLQAFTGVVLAVPVITLVNRAWTFEKDKMRNGHSEQ